MRGRVSSACIGVAVLAALSGVQGALAQQGAASGAKASVAAPSSARPPAANAPRADDDGSPIRVLLAPAQETTLSSQVSARVQAVNVALGDSFVRGKPLVRFDCEEQVARLKMSEAELASARENHEAKLLQFVRQLFQLPAV